MAEAGLRAVGLRSKDLDAAVIYDAFTSIVLWQIESFACAAAANQDFIKGGTLRRNGTLPTNTHGGSSRRTSTA